MDQKHIYDNLSEICSKSTTNLYSTSFSLGILLFSREIRSHIYNIYGFVRLADEIVDSFLEYEQKRLLKEFKEETHKAIDQGISLNPILNSFQKTVRAYEIPRDLIDAFLLSMEMDLYKSAYSHTEVNKYIYGSAEVVGLMCLRVFCLNNCDLYDELAPHARSLGAAFQKVNFLRDLKDDYEVLGRSYFAEIDFESLNCESKKQVEDNIQKDFHDALIGIRQLPASSRFGVYIAYIYYYSLFKKIKSLQFETITQQRVRIPNYSKYVLLVKSWFRYNLNLV